MPNEGDYIKIPVSRLAYIILQARAALDAYHYKIHSGIDSEVAVNELLLFLGILFKENSEYDDGPTHV